jgi:folate-binding protein YgfZ
MLPYLLPANSSTLLDRAIFKLTGADAERYLNGQCSQDVRLVSDQIALYAAVTNFKGKLDGDCYIRRHNGDILIDCPAELREALFQRLDRYIIADDAELTDITDVFDIVHTVEPVAPPEDSWSSNRFGQAGIDQLFTKGAAPTTTLEFSELEKSRISHAIPLWGAELDNETLPPEASLEARAISYTKGCYTGQEVISRIRSAGKTNRHLVLLEIGDSMAVGSPLLCEGATEDKPAGVITSSCEIDGQQIALAYRKRKFQDITLFDNATIVTH